MILSKIMNQNSRIQSLMFKRFMSAPAKGEGSHAGHEHNPNLWKKVFYFVACPALVVCMINTYLAEVEHWGHYTRPEFRPYEYMRIRTTKYPWGDGNRTLFHNPLVNPLPTGWEPLPEHQKKYDYNPDAKPHH